VTTADLKQSVLTGIHAVYQDRRYDIGLLGRYFLALQEAWRACLDLAEQRAKKQFTVPRHYLFIDPSPDEPAARLFGSLGERDLPHVTVLSKREPLAVSRLRIESPMEVTLAVVQGGGVAGIVAYSVHLLVHVMRDPKRVGAWLPRLVAGWHEGMTEVEHARREHDESEEKRKHEEAIAKASSQLVAAAEDLKQLPTAEVTAIGVGEPPDDIVAAFTEGTSGTT
jgi:hypothetical protein